MKATTRGNDEFSAAMEQIAVARCRRALIDADGDRKLAIARLGISRWSFYRILRADEERVEAEMKTPRPRRLMIVRQARQ